MKGYKRCGSCIYIFYKGERKLPAHVLWYLITGVVYLWIFHADLMCTNGYRRESKETIIVRMITASLTRRFPLLLHIKCWTSQHHWWNMVRNETPKSPALKKAILKQEEKVTLEIHIKLCRAICCSYPFIIVSVTVQLNMLSVAHDEEATQVTPNHMTHILKSTLYPHFSVDNFLPSQKPRKLYSRKFSVCACMSGCMRASCTKFYMSCTGIVIKWDW